MRSWYTWSLGVNRKNFKWRPPLQTILQLLVDIFKNNPDSDCHFNFWVFFVERNSQLLGKVNFLSYKHFGWGILQFLSRDWVAGTVVSHFFHDRLLKVVNLKPTHFSSVNITSQRGFINIHCERSAVIHVITSISTLMGHDQWLSWLYQKEILV